MSGGINCYPDTDVLINKYQIHDKKLLEQLEVQKVTIKLLSLRLHPKRIAYTFDAAHLITLHKYLFGDIYEWAGSFRAENLYKAERVLSGGSATYTDFRNINKNLQDLFEQYSLFRWETAEDLLECVTIFLVKLWSIHPFREGNTRTCITFLWHYLIGRGIEFRLELLKNNPMYVRDSLVMANYGQEEYIRRILQDALKVDTSVLHYADNVQMHEEEYKIAQSDYDAFKAKYAIKK